MGLLLACKAFFKALKDPKKANEFVNDTPAAPLIEKKSNDIDPSHLRLLHQLQVTGRLVDFFKEDISGYDDEQIGIAVREIHKNCATAIEDLVTIRPIREENEGSAVVVPQGYDSVSIKLIGNVKGEPPFTGTLVHKGWKAHKRSLPKTTADSTHEVIYPAEIEIK